MNARTRALDSGAKPNILVVDDERQVLNAIGDQLERDFVVHAATGGNAALALLAELKDVSVLLTDQRMPGMRGDELLARAARISDATPVMITGYADLKAVIRAVNESKIFAYVTKPWEESELRMTLQKAAEHHRLARDLAFERALMRNLMDNVPDEICFTGRDNRFIRVNRAAARGLGLGAPEAATGRLETDLLPDPARARAIRDEDEQIFAGAGPLETEEKRHRPDAAARWFSRIKAPVLGERGEVTGVVAIARDITERKLWEEKLLRFQMAMDTSIDSIYLTDPAAMRFVYVNATACSRLGYTREQLLRMNPAQVLGMDEEALRREYDEVSAAGDAGLQSEARFSRSDGSQGWTELQRRALRTASGTLIATIGHDITERKRAATSIRRLNRVYAVLSGINSLIVRVRDRDELFREACRIAVEHGRFKMAWIGIVDRDAMKVVPVASAGAEPEFLTLIRDHFSLRADAPMGNTLTARAIRERKAFVSNDIRKDGTLFAADRIERGIASMCVLPLLVEDDAAGVIAFYADETGFFDDEEMRLLTELAGDIAFGIDHIGKRERLDYLAYYDALTGLANRSLFIERVAQYMRSASGKGHGLALFLIDLERFKNINDSLGRPAGDALLRHVAAWLVRHAGDASLLARLEADHFAVVLPELKPQRNVSGLLEKALALFLVNPFQLNEAVLRVSAKIGAALFPYDGTDTDTLFRNAEAALKKAKASGRRYLFYAPDMNEAVAQKLTLENKLRLAIEKEEFVLHYQPKVNLADGKLTGAEALIRWNDPDSGLVPPGRFIPVLEETGLIHEVGRWALKKAIADFLRWRASGLPAVRIAVNVSPLQLRDQGFIDEIGAVVGVDAQAPDGLELEMTESLIMEDVRHTIASLQSIRDMRVTVAVDDFGTGFSSLSYLAKLPLDTLKIDRSFVIEMTTAPEGLALVSTIINLAHSLRLKVVAEGVETEEQSRMLRLLKCDEMQGYLYSRPVPFEEFTRLLQHVKAGGSASS